jgi:DNA-binding NarL/FixJ family response regulator
MIRVLIIADVRVYREGLTRALSRQSTLQVVGSLSSGFDILTRMARLSPDVVLIDVGIPVVKATVAQIRRRFPSAKTVGLSVNESETEVMRCLEMGLSGYVLRESSLDDLLMTIKAAGRGEIICPPRITAALVERATTLAEKQQGLGGRLTYREREVSTLANRGFSNKQIAEHLNITLATVKNHMHNVLRKLHVHTRRDLAHVWSNGTVARLISKILWLASCDLVPGFTIPL